MGQNSSPLPKLRWFDCWLFVPSSSVVYPPHFSAYFITFLFMVSTPGPLHLLFPQPETPPPHLWSSHSWLLPSLQDSSSITSSERMVHLICPHCFSTSILPIKASQQYHYRNGWSLICLVTVLSLLYLELKFCDHSGEPSLISAVSPVSRTSLVT